MSSAGLDYPALPSRACIRAAIISMATSLKPPSGMMTSAYRLLGSTNLVHGPDGGQVLADHRFHGTTSLGDVPLQAADEADVGVGIHKDLDIHQLSQGLVGKDQDALHQHDADAVLQGGIGASGCGS